MRLVGRLLGVVVVVCAGWARSHTDESRRIDWLSLHGIGRNEGGQATFEDGMPVGNGDTVALVWANVTDGASQLNWYLAKSDAMSSATELLKIALVQLAVSPWAAPGSYFNQSLDMTTGTVTVLAGGVSAATATHQLSLYVDAHSDTVVVTAASLVSAPLTVQATLVPLRPTDVTAVPSFFCEPTTWAKDEVPDPLPAPLALVDPGAVVIFHRNLPSDGNIVNQTLTQQGLGHSMASVNDWWSDRQFGAILAGDTMGDFVRSSATTITTATPIAVATMRLTILSNQTDSVDSWVAQLAAVAAAQAAIPAATRRLTHTAWWTSFWARSHIVINGSLPAATTATSLPPLVLWLDATTLQGNLGHNAPVPVWNDARGPGPNSASAGQATAALQPRFVASQQAGLSPAVRFDGVATFLSGALAVASEQTLVAVFEDYGSTTVCCSGVYFSHPGFLGISTKAGCGPGGDDDDNGGSVDNEPVGLMIDFPDSQSNPPYDVHNRSVVVVLTYNSTGSFMWVDGCLADTQGVVATPTTAFYIGTRNNELGRFFNGALSELRVYSGTLSDADRTAVTQELAVKWLLPSLKCIEPPSAAGLALTSRYAQTRYLQAIQSRNTMWPIKFNGMMFGALFFSPQAPPVNADYRDWGPSNWWQNTRLPYGPMLACGDFDIFETILRYYDNMRAFAEARTMAYFNHTGIFFTETKTIFGAFSPQDYGCTRPDGYPVWLETNDYIHFDYAGDGGTPEVALAVLDHFFYTNNYTALSKYLPIATAAADFFMLHYQNRTTTGKYLFWPVQALETFWCSGWDTQNNQPPQNCCQDDMPLVAGMYSLLSKLLALPPAAPITPAQRAAWTLFYDALPPLPIDPVARKLLPARVLSSGIHNSEAPEMYSVHPYRVFTKALNVTRGLDLTPAINAFYANPLSFSSNSGWNQGLMDAALLGLSETAAAMVIARANTPPAPGYRFPGFAPHEQDYEPSADHYANMMSAINWMLLQPADDALGTIVLFPAWPCEWDVDFMLWGPLNTTVTVVYSGGRLLSLDVSPPERRQNVVWAACVTASA